jgi:dTDP-4-dehydrorhamnose reductase
VRVLVAGAAGQLGRALVEQLGPQVLWAGGRSDLDVRDADAVRERVTSARPDVVINATAYNKVDAAETERDEAFAVNERGPLNLARAAASVGALMVHVSTNYVFDGAKTTPYTEDDDAHPLNEYGRSKRAGERAVMGVGGDHLIVRTSALFGRGGNRAKGGSFIDRVLSRARAGEPLRIVDDQVLSTTYVPDLAAGIVSLLGAGARGMFHVVNDGECTWHTLAAEAVKGAGFDVSVAPVSSEELGAPARRPIYSVLSTGKYRSLGLPRLREWRAALADHLANV